MQDAPKAAFWSIPYVSVTFSPSLKHNFIVYHSCSRPDCIFEIHQLWQSGFSRVYSNCCCSCSFEPEIIKIGQSSHWLYSNNIVNFQESTTILNACTKKSGNLLYDPRTSIDTNSLIKFLRPLSAFFSESLSNGNSYNLAFYQAIVLEQRVRILFYLFSIPPPDKYDTRLFLKWVRTQSRSPHTSGKIPKYLRLHRHCPNGGASDARKQNNKQFYSLYTPILLCLKLIFCCIMFVVGGGIDTYTRHFVLFFWEGLTSQKWVQLVLSID